MIARRGSDLAASLLPQRPGRFIPSIRNRPVGRETLLWVPRLDGGLELSVETELAFNDLNLQQSVLAVYDSTLRPEWCSVIATIDSRAVHLQIDIGRGDAKVRYLSDRSDESRTIKLYGRPLLLVDNCFTSHALAAIAAVGVGDSTSFVSIPVGEGLTVSRCGTPAISLGGFDLGRPTISLHLAPDLDEHVWIGDAWVERLVIPQRQIRIDRVEGMSIGGGGQ